MYERGNRRGREVRFVVARLTGDESWARGRMAHDDDGAGGLRRAGEETERDGEASGTDAAEREWATREALRVPEAGGYKGQTTPAGRGVDRWEGG